MGTTDIQPLEELSPGGNRTNEAAAGRTPTPVIVQTLKVHSGSASCNMLYIVMVMGDTVLRIRMQRNEALKTVLKVLSLIFSIQWREVHQKSLDGFL